MAQHALRLLLALSAGVTSALLVTPMIRHPHPRCDAHTRDTHVRCCAEGVLEGWVSSRRILGSAMAFIDVHAMSDDVEQTERPGRDPVQVLLKASADGEGLRHALDKSFYAVGARVRVTGLWRARGGKAVQSEQWLLVAHTVRVLTAAPSVHGVRSVLDAARSGTMSAAAASAALVYPADPEVDPMVEGAADSVAKAAAGSTEDSAVEVLVAEYAARAEPSAEQAPLAASDERAVGSLLRQLRTTLPPPIVRAALATDGQRPLLKAASAEMQPDAASLAAVQIEIEKLGSRLAAAAALETQAPLPGAAAMARVSGGGGSGGGAPEGGGPAGADAGADAGAGAGLQGWLVVEAEVAKRRRGLASGSSSVAMCVLELQDGLVKAPVKGASKTPAPLLALAHPALHADDAAGRKRFDALKQLGATGSRVRLAGRWVDSAAGPDHARLFLVLAWRLERCCSIPKTVRLAVGSAADGVLADAEAARALRFSGGGSFRAALLAESSAERRWRVAEISERLQAEAPAPQLGSRALSTEQLAALEAHAACREAYRLGGGGESAPPLRASARPALSALSGQADAADAANAADAADTADATASGGGVADGDATGVTGPAGETGGGAAAGVAATGFTRGSSPDGSFLNTKKRPQLRFMTQEIGAVLHAHPAWGKRPLHIVDIGGGKGLLSEHLAREFGDAVQVLGVLGGRVGWVFLQEGKGVGSWSGV